MAVMYGYKQTDLGPLPDAWVVSELGALSPFVTSGSRGWAEHYSEYGAAFIRITNLRRDSIYIDFSDLKRVTLPSADREGRRTQLCEGDLLISITADIGIVGFMDTAIVEPAYINQHIALVRFDNTKVNARFLAYFLAGEDAQRTFKAATDQGAKAGMSLLGVRRIQAALPPIEEQRAIADALRDIDSLLGALDRIIAKKRDIKLAAMQQLLTGQTRLPGFGDKWKSVRSGDVGRFKGGSGFPIRAQGATSGDLPFFKVSDMNNVGNEISMHHSNNWISERVRKQLGATAFPAGCVVFAKVGAAVFLERKKTLTRPSCLDNNMAAFIPDPEQMMPEYARFVLLSIKLGDLVSTTALPSLSGAVLAQISLHIPSVPEQSAIANVLTEMDAELAALERRRNKTQLLKQGMMQELLTGRTRLV